MKAKTVKHKFFTGTTSLLALLPLVCTIGAQPVSGGVIWGTATNISASTDVYTNGIPLYAYAGTATTVNGVTFTAVGSGTTWGNVSLSGLGSYAGNTFGYAGSPFSTLGTTYSNVLAGAAYGGNTGTFTLNGLIPGFTYSVQVWLNDSRNNSATWGRNQTNSSAGGNSVTLAYDATQAAGGVGQFAVGTFTANGTSQAITFSAGATGVSSASGQLNAISVLDTTAITTPNTATWTGGGGTSWGTAGSWNPASVPGSGSSVLFSSASTANLATVLNANFNLYNLMVTTPGGPVSIGGTSTLTITNGIDMSGASQNLAITAPVALGGSTVGFAVANNQTLSFSNVVSGSGALIVQGGGTVSLGGTNTYASSTTIGSGTLTISGAGQLGSGAYAGNITNMGPKPTLPVGDSPR